jgi:hypothetical protein
LLIGSARFNGDRLRPLDAYSVFGFKGVAAASLNVRLWSKVAFAEGSCMFESR